MYRCFNLTLSGNGQLSDEYYNYGKPLYSSGEILIKKKLSEFATSGGDLNATKMQENWFPKVDSHIFISHSHKDEKLAVTLAGMLKYEFGIESFINSCAWGYAIELLKIIDDEFCKSEDGSTYYYDKRNRSTSHVHMMLSTALSMMIDKTECLIFLNTPSSISPQKTISENMGITRSPWIYAEIAMTKLIRRQEPNEHRGGIIKKSMTESVKARAFDMLYDVSVDHMTELSILDLKSWTAKYNSITFSKDPHRALDILYSLKS